MAKANSTGAPPPDKKADALADASVYGLRRDALMIVSSLHRGREFPPMNLFAAQLVFVQGQLCRAALADPPREQSQVSQGLAADRRRDQIARRSSVRRIARLP